MKIKTLYQASCDSTGVERLITGMSHMVHHQSVMGKLGLQDEAGLMRFVNDVFL